jgi:ferric-dicitrate binding protein FerR (iron transport regulator)
MNDLMNRQLMAEANAEEERKLLEWRRASAANEARYQRRRRIWEFLGKARTPVARPAPSAEELIARAGVRRLPETNDAGFQRTASAPSRRRFRYRVAVAGTLAAAAIATVILSLPPSIPTFGAVEFIAGPHETTTIRLDDGTVVRLGPSSRIEFNGESPRERQVYFEGVAYFAVARDEARPFVIRTRGGNAEVLGTRFEIRAQNEEVRVVVVEGRVALQADGERKEVAANQMGHAGTNQPPTVVDVEDVNDFVGWIDGLLVFQATPLDQVARELSERYGVKIDIQDEELARREVTAWLRQQSFDAALTAVCGAVGAICTISHDGATMRLPAR